MNQVCLFSIVFKEEMVPFMKKITNEQIEKISLKKDLQQFLRNS